MQPAFKINLNDTPSELRKGMKIVTEAYPKRFNQTKEAYAINFIPDTDSDSPGLKVLSSPEGTVNIYYKNRIHAFRALGRLLGTQASKLKNCNFTETTHFDTMGLMLDASRNAVFLPSELEQFICKAALMGLNMLMLYTEDTYTVPGEPFFGYLRGRYTQQELRALDRYADALGVEMIPCMQTLGHLEQILQWPAYAELADTNRVLLAKLPQTYELLEKMIKAASAPHKSKRIHIGMDEAHGVGTGRYLKLYGKKSSFDILNQHLKQVRDICNKQDLRPMIWSDMYFRLGSKTNAYYDLEAVIPQKAIKAIPRDVDLVYWDYYHHEQSFYEEYIRRHRALGSEPIMAGGIYLWDHFWTALPWTLSVSTACLQACKATKLREVFMTLWGDDGAEHNLFSAMPALQFFAEQGYAEKTDDKQLKASFAAICDADYDSFFDASEIDSPAYLRRKVDYGSASNLSKALLWQDPLLAIIDPQISDPERLSKHYKNLAVKLDKATKRGGNNAYLRHPALLARVLSLKVVLRHKLAAAYKADNKAALKKIAQTDLRELRRLIRQLWKLHRAYWLAHRKPHGWETIERRYGGLMARLDSVQDRLADLLAGRIESIPELDEKLLKIWPALNERIAVRYPRISTPSCIK